MDGEQADGVGALFLGHRLQLLRPDRLLLLHEADEALDVGSAQLLVGASQAGELPQVRIATPSVPLRQHGQVVVVLGDDRLAEALEREANGGGDQSVVPLLERPQQARVPLGEIVGKLPLEARVERAPSCCAAQEDERVVREADDRRGQHGDERDVVVTVVEQPQVRQQVDDLLLAEVAASGGPVSRQAEGPQLLLVPLGVRAGSK